MDRVIQSLITGALIIAGLLIVYSEWSNLINLTGNMEDVCKMFIAVAFIGTGIVTFIQNDSKLKSAEKGSCKQ